MSEVWEWLVGPQSDCLRLVSAMVLLVAWLNSARARPPVPRTTGRDER